MRLLVVTLALTLLSIAPLEAQQPQPTIVVSKDGIYFLTADAAGKPVLTRATNVVVLGDPGSIPVPPTDPPTTPVDPFFATLGAEIKAVNNLKAQQAVGLVYRTIGEYVRDGKLRPGDAATALGTATDQILATEGMGGTAPWKQVREVIGSEWNRRLQSGDLTNQQEISKFILDLAKVLETTQAAGNSEAEALTPESIDAILAIIKLVLSVFLRDATGEPIGPV